MLQIYLLLNICLFLHAFPTGRNLHAFLLFLQICLLYIFLSILLLFRTFLNYLLRIFGLLCACNGCKLQILLMLFRQFGIPMLVLAFHLYKIFAPTFRFYFVYFYKNFYRIFLLLFSFLIYPLHV